MRSWMIAFSLGIFLGGLIPGIPNATFLPLLFIPVILCLGIYECRLLGAYCLGLYWVLNWAVISVNELLPAELERQDFWVRGEIVSLPEIDGRQSQFVFKVNNACLEPLSDCDFSDDILAEQLIQLSLYQHKQIIPGQRWQFKVRLKRPHGFLNPGGFDYEAWLWQKEIRASGYVRDDESNALLIPNEILNFQYLRYQFLLRLNQLFPNQSLKHLNLILALSIGDRQSITDDQWTLFNATGTTQLMGISGKHVSLLALFIYQFSKMFLSRLCKLVLYIPAARIAEFLAILVAYLYAAMAGFGLPAQRAFLMVATFMFAQCICRHSTSSNSYCLALALVLLINPLAPVGSGFWLSFIAVAMLIFVIKQTETAKTTKLVKIKNLFKTQLYIFLGLLPFMLLFYQQSSISAPLVNLFAIPFITLLIVPLCLAILLVSFFSSELVTFLCLCVDRLLEKFLLLLKVVNTYWPHALLDLPSLALWQWLLFFILMVLTLYQIPLSKPWPLIKIVFGALSMLAILFIKDSKLELDVFQLDILDVGQGLAIVIRTREHVMLYDLGPSYSDNFNAGEGIILPFLRSENVKRVDKVIVSHGDLDHIGGLEPILTAFPAAEYISSNAEVFPAEFSSIECREGQYWQWDGVNFEILHPDHGNYNRNNSSCVLKVRNARHSVLLTGDIESRIERRLLAARANVESDILIAPHHGSKTSSSRRFITAVSPDFVVFSNGYLNQFKHPHPDIVKLYTNSGTIGYSTAQTGTISWLIGSNDSLPEASLYRESYKRFWRLFP